MAKVLVQNRVAAPEPLLAEDVKRQGLTTRKQSTNMVQVVNLLSPDGRYGDIYISNYYKRVVPGALLAHMAPYLLENGGGREGEEDLLTA